MSKKQKRILVTTILSVILSIFILERIYNSRKEFHVTAENASYYGIIEANLTTKEKLQDFEYLYDVLEQNYPFFKVNERLHGIDWLGNKSKYKRMIRNTKNDAKFLVAINQMIEDLNNRHVNVFSRPGFQWLYEDYYERFAFRNNLDSLSRYVSFTDHGVMLRYHLIGMKREKFNDKSTPRNSILETEVLIKDQLAYMKVKTMAYADTMDNDYSKIRSFLKEIEDYEKLIIDIRGNGGGVDEYWKNIVELLTKETLQVSYYSFYKDKHKEPFKLNRVKTIKMLDEEILEQFPEEVKTDFTSMIGIPFVSIHGIKAYTLPFRSILGGKFTY